MSATTLILLFFVIANLPWISDRVFCIYLLKTPKKIIIRLVETLVFYMVILSVSVALELRFSGDIYPQGWEFFTTIFCLFIVMAVPGVIFCYQWSPQHS